MSGVNNVNIGWHISGRMKVVNSLLTKYCSVCSSDRNLEWNYCPICKAALDDGSSEEELTGINNSDFVVDSLFYHDIQIIDLDTWDNIETLIILSAIIVVCDAYCPLNATDLCSLEQAKEEVINRWKHILDSVYESWEVQFGISQEVY